MRAEEREEIVRHPLLAACQAETLDLLLQGAFVQRFPAHTQLTREGEKADFLYAVLSGAIELAASWLDRETTIAVIGPPHTFIVAAVALDRLYLQSARVLEPSRILMLPAAPIRKAMRTDAGFATAIAEEMANAYRNVAQELKNQKLRTSLERLANWLVHRDKETGGGHRFIIPFEKKILAARLGMAPEALSRAFATLVKYDVRIDGATVVVKDWAALEKLAHPDPLIDDETI
ncbi:cyclic nucleotide-binding domain-containing protein [Rhodoblastus sp. 17X3]|uniref:cyclic nucleotide-binding domain-containing protein n=1 Tax=Rhodoblastus sp. 17X3 TaxID=3047026 RepID=UPI0024B72D16|nr:cyclic nucleotide-binding domain-containing protein [Rhodoblastus sp. 17X3]MDI9847798.1 cyclic nucleotide-binding domain-containing protein [Rhodoblastus sp. 17X3]